MIRGTLIDCTTSTTRVFSFDLYVVKDLVKLPYGHSSHTLVIKICLNIKSQDLANGLRSVKSSISSGS